MTITGVITKTTYDNIDVEVAECHRDPSKVVLVWKEHEPAYYLPDPCCEAIVSADFEEASFTRLCDCSAGCREVQGIIDRLKSAYNGADYGGIYGKSYDLPHEAVQKVIDRLGGKVCTLNAWGYGVTVSDTYDYSTEYVVISAYPAQDFARECAAYSNNETWTVGLMDKALYQELVEEHALDPALCDDTIHGLVWENVDYEGYSTPSSLELAHAL
ncbi:hypothetical protein [Corynebacterium sp. NML120713]|uniref:hypothetical protein n=1 Tax=Corynebacterium sp. NML120713 TaxID=1906332 RepID=UPI0008FAE814|nr:hypothetical protein [Corynebacterium sp. NML120713]OIR43189.1 hypothetical protein BJP06_06310 [Corynebacterium sp. NML120713]